MPTVVNVTPAPQKETFEITLTQDEIKSVESVFPYLLATHVDSIEQFGGAPEEARADSNVVLSILSALLPVESYDSIVSAHPKVDDYLLDDLTEARQGVEGRQ